MIKLVDILKEVGELGSKKGPYPTKRFSRMNPTIQVRFTTYNFTTESDMNYLIKMDLIMFDRILVVSFAAKSTSDKDFSFDDVVNKGEFYRVIETVALSIIKEVKNIKESGKMDDLTIKISPAKNFSNDERRTNIYLNYISKNLDKIPGTSSVKRTIEYGQTNLEVKIEFNDQERHQMQKQFDYNAYLKNNPLLKELTKPKPEDAYPFDDVSSKRMGTVEDFKYVYTNVLNDQMEIDITVRKSIDPIKEPGASMSVSFAPYDPDREEYSEEDEESYSAMTGANDVLKVLATVAEAVRRSTAKYGGLDNLYAVTVHPSNAKRARVYKYYIETLFPNFKIDSKSSSTHQQRYTNSDLETEKDTINEIGEIDPEFKRAYSLSKPRVSNGGYTRDSYQDFYTTESDIEYRITMFLNRDEKELEVSFAGKKDEASYYSFKDIYNRGEFYRIMETVGKALSQELKRIKEEENIEVLTLVIRPAKNFAEDERRKNIYLQYVEKNLNNREITHGEAKIARVGTETIKASIKF